VRRVFRSAFASLSMSTAGSAEASRSFSSWFRPAGRGARSMLEGSAQTASGAPSTSRAWGPAWGPAPAPAPAPSTTPVKPYAPPTSSPYPYSPVSTISATSGTFCTKAQRVEVRSKLHFFFCSMDGRCSQSELTCSSGSYL